MTGERGGAGPPRALVMGRFQPFHLGHLDLARRALAGGGGLVVAVTGAQFNYIEKDPFTAGERLEMIHGSLSEDGADMSRCMVVPIENQFNAATWAGYLRAALPRFGRIYSGNAYVRTLLGDSGMAVEVPPMLDRMRLSGTRIRALMASGGDWRACVPPAAARVIDEAGGPARMAAILESGADPTSH